MRAIATTLSILTLILLCCGLPLRAEEGETPLSGDAPTAEQLPARSCAEWVELEKMEHALWACRDEFEENRDSVEAVEQMAQLEYDYGEPDKGADLYAELIERNGWSLKYSRARAMALWRAKDLSGAEKIFRSNLQRSPEIEQYSDLINFLLTFGESDEAAELAAKAAKVFPEQCSFFEMGAVAETSRGDDDKAVKLIKKAVDGGCPPYRWTTLGPLPEKRGSEPFLSLLVPTEIVNGLRETSDRECEMRLQLLRLVLSKEVAPQITTEVLLRDKLEVRFEGLGLLSQLGSSVMESWQKLLASDDYILRKYTLRRIREIGDPAFIPLLETRMTKEDSPRNLVLTRLVLGELLLADSQEQRAEELLLEIPEDDVLYAVGIVAMADHAEAQGNTARALSLLEQALEANPEIHVDRDRLKKLKKAIADEATPDAG